MLSRLSNDDVTKLSQVARNYAKAAKYPTQKAAKDAADKADKAAKAAFDRLYEHYYPDLLLLIPRKEVIRGRSITAEEAEDVAGDLRCYSRKRISSWKEDRTFCDFMIDNLDVVVIKGLAVKASKGGKEELKVLRDHYTYNPDKVTAINACLGDDRDAFDQLWKLYNQALTGYIRGKTRTDFDADDVGQTMWEYCWRKKNTYNPFFSFYTFLRNIARSRIMEYYADRGRGGIVNESDLHGPTEDEGGRRLEELAHSGSGGGAPFPDPTIIISLLELLCITFRCSAKAHQMLTFGFHRLLQWTPREIVKDLSKGFFWDLSEKLYEDYAEFFRGYTDNDLGCVFDDAFNFLFLKLKINIDQVYTEAEYKDLRSRHGREKVGSAKLEDFYGKDWEHSISYWSDRAKKRVRAIVEGKNRLCQE
jgi:hypothetical protein